MTRPDNLSVAELEEEIAATRARLSHGLAVIDREYALRPILLRSWRLAHGRGLHPHAVASALRQDMLPLALIGAGLAWLAFGRKESGDLLRRLAEGFAQMQRLAHELLTLAGTRDRGM